MNSIYAKKHRSAFKYNNLNEKKNNMLSICLQFEIMLFKASFLLKHRKQQQQQQKLLIEGNFFFFLKEQNNKIASFV